MMAKKILFVLITGIIFCSLAGGVFESFEGGKNIRVFIEFYQDKGIMGRNVQSLIMNEIGEENIKYNFGDKISAFVSEEEFEMLKKNSRIKSIEKEKVRQILLQDSVPLINATPTFNLQVNGLNLTGAGQSVCIIDTGINYSHIDLGGCWGNNSNVSKCKVWGG